MRKQKVQVPYKNINTSASIHQSQSLNDCSQLMNDETTVLFHETTLMIGAYICMSQTLYSHLQYFIDNLHNLGFSDLSEMKKNIEDL